ncbi:TonB-dependent receptor domain-containing protein [Brevundimonas staleyi]|uniref:TonB-dependent receptor domain-containing protein n=1 Tax=Brevundimonas staleyi TaxID=74326 RepID=A0ABW0FVX3_9CAUL
MTSSKLLLSCGVAAAVSVMASQAAAQVRAFQVPAQPAVTAIPEFARQARVQIIAPARDLEDVRTQAVNGEMDLNDALQRLIAGTPLRVASRTDQLITLRSELRGNRQAGEGAVEGAVVDPVTGEFLRNAAIEMVAADGERRSITAGEGGEYRVSGLPAGPARLVVRFTGYPDQAVSLNVAPGATTRIDVQMTRPGFEAVQVDDVVVAGSRDGDARAIMSQRQSMNITNSLSSESFGDISEGNPGEFIKFMPGVDTDSTGDGTVRNVQLRGLPPAYTSITVNGVNLAAADGNTGADASRTFSFEQMSLSAIDSIEISKTISADVDANAPAGTINIRTKRAFDRRGRRMFAQFSGTTHSDMWDSAERSGPADGGYGNRRFLPNWQVEFSDTFLDRRLGVVAGLSQSNMYVEQEQIEASRSYAPTAASPEPMAITAINTNLYAREISRFSASLNLDFRATDRLTLSLASIYNEASIWAGTTSIDFTTAARSRGVIGDPVFDITTQAAATTNTLSVQNLLTYKDGRGTTLIPSFEYDAGRFRLDGTLSYSNSLSTYDPQGIKNSAYILSPITSRGNFSAQRDPGDLLNQRWNIRQLSGGDWSDPASFLTGNAIVLRTNSNMSAEHTSTGATMNLTFEADAWSIPVIFKTGFKFQRAEYDYENPSDLNRYSYRGPLTSAELLAQVRSTNQISLADSGITLTTLNGSNDIYVPSTYRLLELYRANPQDWVQTTATTPSEWYAIYVGNSRHYREDSAAAYFMGTADLTSQLRVRAGLRWERTETAALEPDALSAQEVAAAGYAVSASTGRATTIPGLEYQFLSRPKVERTGEYDYFFPSASLKYAFTDSIDLQVGYSRTIRRPEVGVLSGVWSINEEQQIITAPNPGLEPELSDNLSIRLSKYFEPVGMVAINYYRNRVKGLFQQQDLTAEEFGYTGQDYAGYLFRTTTTVGGDAIDIQGYELEFSHAMDYLPGLLDGLSVRGSFMINDPEIPIVRSADRLATLALSYRKGPVKLFLNTVWTDDKYRTTTPSWFAAYWDTNLSGSYEVRPGWEAFFTVRNLLNRPRNVVVPGSLATSGELGDHSAIFIHGGTNATLGFRARF